MPKLFEIKEEDVSELERTLPQLADALTSVLDNRLRVQLRRCQAILSKVRWNYGPPLEVDVVPSDPDQSS